MMIALSFLGTGNYGKVTYTWDGQSCQTNLFQEAVQKFFEVDRHVVLMTEAADNEWGNRLQERVEIKSVRIPSGENEDELWTIFSTLGEKVPEGAVLTVDVTHGFRSQPLLALAACLYLHAAKDVTVERIVYGAYEARSGDAPNDTAPVFDLTPFMNLAQWATAARLARRYGNATPLSDELQDIHGNTRRQRGGGYASQGLHGLGKALDRLMTALATVRPKEAAQWANTLPDHLARVKADVEQLPQSRPLRTLLDPFRERFEPMGSDWLFSEQGFAAQAKMLQFYLNTDQYQQAITLAREALVSKQCVDEEGKPDEQDDREAAAETLNRRANEIQESTEEATRLAELWGNIRRVRNDINHAGLGRGQTLSSDDLVDQITEYAREAADVITP